MSEFPTLCVVNYDDDVPDRRFRYVSTPPRTSRDVTSSSSNCEYTVLTSPPVPRAETTVPYRLSARTSSTKPNLNSDREPQTRSYGSYFRDSDTVQSHVYSEFIPRERIRTTHTNYSLPTLKNGWGDTSHTVNAEMLDLPRWNKYLNAWVSGNQDDEGGLFFRFNHGSNLYDRGRYHYVPEFDEFPHLPCPRFHAHMEKTPVPKQTHKKKKKILKPPEFWHYKRKEEPPKPLPKRKGVPDNSEHSDYGSAVGSRITSGKSATSTSGKSILTIENLSENGSSHQNEFELFMERMAFSIATQTVDPNAALTGQTPNYAYYNRQSANSSPVTPKKPTPPPPEPIRLPTPKKTPTPTPPPPPPPVEESSESEEEVILDIKYANDYSNNVDPFIIDTLEVFSVTSLDSVEDGLVMLEFDAPPEFQYNGRDNINFQDEIRVCSPITRMEPPPAPPPKLPPPPKTPTPPPPPRSPTPPPKEPTPPPTPPPPPKPKKKKEIKKKEKKVVVKPPKTPTPPPRTPTPPPKEPTPTPPPPPSPPPLPTELPPLPVVEMPVVQKAPVKHAMDIPAIKTPSPTPPPTPEPEKKGRRKVDWSKRRAKLMYERVKKRAKSPPPPPREEVTFKDYGWLAQFCILKKEKVEMYRRAFEAVDEDEDGYLNCFETILALKGIAGSNNLTETEEEYTYRILEMADYKIINGTDFRLFAIVAALTQRIARLDDWMKNIINRFDFKMLDMKIFRAKDLFLWNVDQNSNKISIQQLMIELKAGGVSEEHQEEVQVKLGHLGELDLLDFMTYVPLFIMLHESVVDNPLDDSRDK
ncbi:uncharacterized protein [Ptychodera flava]|uniref:uncharacterized protein isoform X4 n=1 Tax=Ptychodera flava TaxID=63121 RepID=UPI00396A6D34